MSRLTKRNAMLKASCKKNGTYDCLLEDDCEICDYNNKILEKLAHYEDLEEQGRLIDSDRQVDEGYLYDWYIHSVCDTDTPVWTEEHIKELASDFILIPRAKLAELQSFPTLPILHGNVAPASREDAMERLGLRDNLSELKGE